MKHFQYSVMGPGNLLHEEFRMGHQTFGGNIISPPAHPGSYFMTGPLLVMRRNFIYTDLKIFHFQMSWSS